MPHGGCLQRRPGHCASGAPCPAGAQDAAAEQRCASRCTMSRAPRQPPGRLNRIRGVWVPGALAAPQGSQPGGGPSTGGSRSLQPARPQAGRQADTQQRPTGCGMRSEGSIVSSASWSRLRCGSREVNSTHAGGQGNQQHTRRGGGRVGGRAVLSPLARGARGCCSPNSGAIHSTPPHSANAPAPPSAPPAMPSTTQPRPAQLAHPLVRLHDELGRLLPLPQLVHRVADRVKCLLRQGWGWVWVGSSLVQLVCSWAG